MFQVITWAASNIWTNAIKKSTFDAKLRTSLKNYV